MMTMKQIYRFTPANRIEKASTTVKVIKVKYGVDKRTQIPTAVALVYSKDVNKTGKTGLYKYPVSIGIMKKRHVHVSCSCPDFLHRWEYALTKRGASSIQYSNGEPPLETNPALQPGCCKHIIAFYHYLEDKGVKF